MPLCVPCPSPTVAAANGATLFPEEPHLLPVPAVLFDLAEISLITVDWLPCVRVRTNRCRLIVSPENSGKMPERPRVYWLHSIWDSIICA